MQKDEIGLFKNQVKFNGKQEKKWYVFYTYPRAEKVIEQELLKRDYEVFLPTLKTLRQWKNRQKKWIEFPLFPSYIFVNTILYEIYNIKQIRKVATCVSCAGMPSFIPIKDIEVIQKMISLDQEVTVENCFHKGDNVRILYGPLAGYEGLLIKQNGKTRFGIQLKEINHTVLIDINTSAIEKI